MRKGDLITIYVHHLCGTMDLASVDKINFRTQTIEYGWSLVSIGRIYSNTKVGHID